LKSGIFQSPIDVLRQIVQGQRPADPAASVIDDVDRCLRRLESSPLLAPRPMARTEWSSGLPTRWFMPG
jgi:hypothetical protein